MSLKDELEKIIQAELGKRENEDRREKDSLEQHHKRFQPMRALLEELAQSVEPCYLKVDIYEGLAKLELREPNRMNWDIRWHVAPNHNYVPGIVIPKPGIRVEEQRNYWILPDPDISEKLHIFANEQEAMTYLVTEIAKKVASYRYSASSANKRRNKNESN
jgi:hypothetical protein